MSLDDVLFAVIVGGVGLCAAHFRDEYIGWRKHRAAELRRESNIRALHVDSYRHRADADSNRSMVNLKKDTDAKSGDMS
jgi:hypothetical protein